MSRNLHCLNCKLAAIARLDYDELVGLVGYRDRPDRLALYDSLRGHLSDRARSYYWDDHSDAIASGPIRVGRIDLYFRFFQKTVISPVVGDRQIEWFLSISDPALQKRAFQELFGTVTFQNAFRSYYGRESMVRSGRDISQLAFVDENLDIGSYLWTRFEWVMHRAICARQPVPGAFSHQSLSRHLSHAVPWLSPANVARLRPLLGRLRLQQAELGALLKESKPGSFSKSRPLQCV